MDRYDIDFPGAHAAPICSGRMKVSAEDFQVTENPGFEPGGSGEHLFVKVRKTDANTAWVARHPAKRNTNCGLALEPNAILIVAWRLSQTQ